MKGSLPKVNYIIAHFGFHSSKKRKDNEMNDDLSAEQAFRFGEFLIKYGKDKFENSRNECMKVLISEQCPIGTIRGATQFFDFIENAFKK